MPCPRLCNPLSFSILTNQGQKAKKGLVFLSLYVLSIEEQTEKESCEMTLPNFIALK